MKSLFIRKNNKYDGSQLKPLYAYENHKILGPSVISWVGPCEITIEHMVDLEDKIANEEIRGDLMLHFIIEFFDQSLFSAVALQRLFASLVGDLVRKMSSVKLDANNFFRKGDDLYFVKNKKTLKLSISIAGQSAVSSMVHFALNIVNEGTPVSTTCLNDLGIKPDVFAREVMAQLVAEYQSIVQATQKARPLT